MSTRKENFIENEYYHVYNRGNSKQEIFLDNQDRERFVKLLYLCNTTKSFNFREDIVDRKIDAFEFDTGDRIVSIGAWVLMPNHFHVYLTPRGTLGEKGVSLFMNKLGTAYSMYFNKKYKRTGKLFEGTFKSVHVESDEQAKYIFSYIHLNPVKLIDQNWRVNGIKDIQKTLKFLDNYKWGSYQDFNKVSRLENKILSPDDFPDYFSEKNLFKQEIFDWLDYEDNFSDQT